MIIKRLTVPEFDMFTSNNFTSIYQNSNYGFAMKGQGFECLYYGGIDGNNIYAASLILIKKDHGFKYAFAPRGFIIDYSNEALVKEFTMLLKKELKSIGVVAIRINPPVVKSIYQNKQLMNNNNYDNILNNLKKIGFKHLGFNNYFENLKPRFEAIVPLNKNIQLVFNRINKSFRTKIRTADKKGVKIYKGDETNLDNLFLQTKNKYPRDLKYFQDVYTNFKNNNEIEFYYSILNTQDYVKRIQYNYQAQTIKCNQANANVFKNVLKNNTKSINKKLIEEKKLDTIKKELVYATNLLKQYPKGIITSSALIIKNKTEVYLIMDGYDKSYRNLNSKHLLLWKLIEKFSYEGFKTFNLGGISNYNLQNNKYNGLIKFKTSFGSVIYEYMGDLELITNKPLYLMYKNSSSVMKLLKK